MKKLFKSYSKSKVALALSTAIILGGCGDTDQDEGVVSTSEQVFGGQAIDGYLARSTVFIDTNNDGTRNAWEPFAFTDNEGYYSYNPNTDTNYCASTATAEEAQYCLRTNTAYSSAVIRIDGGYDVQTGEPFVGQLSRRLTEVDDTGISDTIISPISSLLTNVEESNQAAILNALNIEESDLDVDYLNVDGMGTPESNLLNTSLKIHKVVTVLSDRLTDTYNDIGEELGTPNDATSSVYPSLADQLLSVNTSFDNLLGDSINLTQVLDNAENALRDVYERKDLTLPTDLGSVDNPSNFTRIVDVATSIADVVDNLIDPNAVISESDALGGIRALESVVIKTLEEQGEDTTIDNAINFFTGENNDELVESLLTSLSLDTADVSLLSNNDFIGDDFNSVEEVSESATLPADALPFTQIAGLTLKVSDLDLGQAPNNLQDKEVEFYFNGSTGDLSGSFDACVKFIDDASIDGTLGEGNTRGELISGFWSLLGAEADNVESYSLLVTLTFLESTYQAILKPNGEQTIGEVIYDTIRFDFDGELNSYHSESGFIDTISVPTTSEDCLERLPSRIGI